MNPSSSGVLPLNLVKAWRGEGLKSLSRFVRDLLPWPLPIPRGLRGLYLVSSVMLDGFTCWGTWFSISLLKVNNAGLLVCME